MLIGLLEIIKMMENRCWKSTFLASFAFLSFFSSFLVACGTHEDIKTYKEYRFFVKAENSDTRKPSVFSSSGSTEIWERPQLAS